MGSSGQEKLSFRLVEVARLLLGDDDAEPGHWRSGVCLAALAWNLSLLPQEVRDCETRELLDDLWEKAGIDPDALNDVLESLIERKLLLYPDDRRRVLKWQVRTSRRQARVVAVSALPDPD